MELEVGFNAHLSVVLLQDHDDRVPKFVGLGNVVNPQNPGKAVAAGGGVCKVGSVILIAPQAELLPPAEV